MIDVTLDLEPSTKRWPLAATEWLRKSNHRAYTDRYGYPAARRLRERLRVVGTGSVL